MGWPVEERGGSTPLALGLIKSRLGVLSRPCERGPASSAAAGLAPLLAAASAVAVAAPYAGDTAAASVIVRADPSVVAVAVPASSASGPDGTSAVDAPEVAATNPAAAVSAVSTPDPLAANPAAGSSAVGPPGLPAARFERESHAAPAVPAPHAAKLPSRAAGPSSSCHAPGAGPLLASAASPSPLTPPPKALSTPAAASPQRSVPGALPGAEIGGCEKAGDGMGGMLQLSATSRGGGSGCVRVGGAVAVLESAAPPKLTSACASQAPAAAGVRAGVCAADHARVGVWRGMPA
eukprot:716502-Pelagomonas_calceolata.AAC.2